tara:strand:- start:10 stop:420 length:411 start_codon:yes stop_codon:yes gene_type:complete
MTTISKLAKMKLEVINFHTTDRPSVDGPVVNTAFLTKLASDACYVSNNGLTYKKKQLADSLAEYDQAFADKNSYAIERTERWINTLMPELEELQARHDADCQVYTVLTGGEAWTAKKKPSTNVKAANFSALRKMVS